MRAGTFPISIDWGRREIARRPEVQARSQEIRAALGKPDTVLLGVDRLDYTKGILHRLKAYAELLAEGRLGPPVAVLVQVASPSRERVEQYQPLREEVEATVGRINGEHGEVGRRRVHYLHQSYPRDEMAALYLAADVMLVTPLRDGMNLVAKEYVACRHDETRRPGAQRVHRRRGRADRRVHRATRTTSTGSRTRSSARRTVSPREARRRMRSMRRQVYEHDVNYWAHTFLEALEKPTMSDHASAEPPPDTPHPAD